MKTYPNFFLKALAAWQNGWGENADRPRRIISDLNEAISLASELPIGAFQCSEACYRKRFLVPNNRQNGGDLWPLFWDGAITEGVASWTTNYVFATVSFKKLPRPGRVLLRHYSTKPSQADVVLNIKALWEDPEFIGAVRQYQSSGDAKAPA